MSEQATRRHDVLLTIGLRGEAEAEGEQRRRRADHRLDDAGRAPEIAIQAQARPPMSVRCATAATGRRPSGACAVRRSAAADSVHALRRVSDDGLRPGGRARCWRPPAGPAPRPRRP
jgi:hypothetical protein